MTFILRMPEARGRRAWRKRRYAMIHEGSDETVYCATRQGRDRCYDVKIQMWGG